MSENLTAKSIECLLAEADQLVQQINADALKDLREEHRLQVEIHAQFLKKIKAEVRGKIMKNGTSETDPVAGLLMTRAAMMAKKPQKGKSSALAAPPDDMYQ